MLPPSSGSKHKQQALCLLHVVFLFGLLLDPKMKVACSSETSVNFHWTVQSYILEDRTHREMSRLGMEMLKEKDAHSGHKMTSLT
jgi:hypothetical protein